MLRDIHLEADGKEHALVLEPAITVTGYVTDAESGGPIDHFKVIPGYRKESMSYDWSDRLWGTNGVFRLVFAEMGTPIVRVDADDYELAEAEATLLSARDGVCDIQLKHIAPERFIRGTVLQSDGTPAVGVDVALSTLQHRVHLFLKRLEHGADSQYSAYGPADFKTQTDAQGRFQFKLLPGAHTVSAAS